MLALAIILAVVGIVMIFFSLTGYTDMFGTPYAGLPAGAIIGTIFVIVSVILFVVRFVFM